MTTGTQGTGVLLNGSPIEVPAGTTVAQLVDARLPSHRGIAVARNDEVVARSAWDGTTLDDGDRIEILTAAQGG